MDDQLATTIVAGALSQSISTVLWVQTQYVRLLYSLRDRLISDQHMGILRSHDPYSRQPRSSILEAPQSPHQPCPPFHIHLARSLHSWDRRRVLRQCHCHPGPAHHLGCIHWADGLHVPVKVRL